MKYRKLYPYKYKTTTSYTIEVDIQIADSVSVGGEYVKLYDNRTLFIKNGYAWDGPSGPTIDTETFMRGSLVHDALYQLIREGHIGKERRKASDKLLREICLEDGMNPIRAWYVYWAVRAFGGSSAKGKRR